MRIFTFHCQHVNLPKTKVYTLDVAENTPAVELKPQRRRRRREPQSLFGRIDRENKFGKNNKQSIDKHSNKYVVAKVNWRIKYTLAPNFEANVYISPKLQTWRLMCTLSPNLEAKVNFNFQLRSRLGLV